MTSAVMIAWRWVTSKVGAGIGMTVGVVIALWYVYHRGSMAGQSEAAAKRAEATARRQHERDKIAASVDAMPADAVRDRLRNDWSSD